MDSLRVMGQYDLVQYRQGELINRISKKNGITNGGLDKLLQIMFHFTASINTWYIGLIDNSGFSALAATDTMGSHPGWTEFTDYNELNRPAWDESAPSGQIVTSSATSDFNITGSGNINGIFVTSQNGKGGTSGTLWATGSFTSSIGVANGDILNITYTVTASAA